MRACDFYHIISTISGECRVKWFDFLPAKTLPAYLVLMKFTNPQDGFEEYKLYFCTNDKYPKFLQKASTDENRDALDVITEDCDIRLASIASCIEGNSIDEIDGRMEECAKMGQSKHFSFLANNDVQELYKKLRAKM